MYLIFYNELSQFSTSVVFKINTRFSVILYIVPFVLFIEILVSINVIIIIHYNNK
jgi:hypothetical protein